MQEFSNIDTLLENPALIPEKSLKISRDFSKKHQPLSINPSNNIERLNNAIQNFWKSHNLKVTSTDKKIKILPPFIDQSSALHFFLVFKNNSIHVFLTITPSIIYISIKSTAIKLNSGLEQISPQLNQINSKFLKFSLHYTPSSSSESYENWNILLISRLLHFYYYNDKEIIKYCWKTIEEGVEFLYEKIKILKNINKPLNLINFWEQNKIKPKEVHEILKKGVSMLNFKNIKESKGKELIFLINVCDDRGGLKAWSTFPLIFETKTDIIEAKIIFALNQCVVTFEDSDYEILIEFLLLVNSSIDFGVFVWNSKRNQVQLKMTFCYKGYSKENLQNLPKEIINDLSTYKAYAKGLSQIYNKRNPVSPIEIFNYCKRELLANKFDEDSDSFIVLEEVKPTKKLALQLKRNNYFQEKKIFSVISSREVLKDIFQAENVHFFDKNYEIKYEFIEGKELSKAIPHIKLVDIFEEFSKEMYNVNLTFLKNPLDYLTVIEGKLKFCYKGNSLQNVIQIDKNKTDYYDFMKACFDYLEIYLCVIINKK